MRYSVLFTSLVVIANMVAAALVSKAGSITICSISSTPSQDEWVVNASAGGLATIVELAPSGGDLNANQPGGAGIGGSHLGAVRLTTTFDNASRGEILSQRDYGPGDFGAASDVLADIEMAYFYYKASNPGQNLFAAPALKLDLFNPTALGDGYGQLIYEPTWNQPGGGIKAPPLDSWQEVLINQDTGGLDGTNTGGWWWTGGFGQPNSAGGPPLRSLVEWNTLFAASSDYAGARITAIRVGVGTYNQGQIGYVDGVRFASRTIDNTYVFTVPEPGVGIGLVAVLVIVIVWRDRVSRR